VTTAEIRTCRPDEVDRAVDVFLAAMGEPNEGAHGSYLRAVAEPDSVVVAHDGDGVVGAALSVDASLTLPGPQVVPLAWVTGVGVLPTHRRRGLLRKLMTLQLQQLHDAEVAVAALRATEATIYRRFGYGPAAPELRVTINPRRASFHRMPEAPGRLRLYDQAAALEVIPRLHPELTALSPGEVSWASRHWSRLLDVVRANPPGGARWSTVVHEDVDGRPDGYASYVSRYVEARVDVHVNELHAADDAVRAVLLRFCLDLDLAVGVHLRMPPDDPLLWWLEDTHAISTTGAGSGPWIRIVRVAEALTARSYRSDGRVVLDVLDTVLPANSRRWELVVEDGKPRCAETEADADITLDVAHLGSLLLGGHKPSTLALAGRLTVHRAEVIADLDALFPTDRLPFSHADL
jgi:predicted acetyltransferase